MLGLPISFISLVAWILASTLVATLPLRFQYRPGLTLLLLAPVLVGWLASEIGLGAAAFAVFAVLSMFRRPLRYLTRKAVGLA